MRPSQLRKTLGKAILAGLPVLIKGRPGIGKSDVVGQASNDVGAHMVLMHPVVSDPTDFKGMPGIVDGRAEFLPFGDLRTLTEATELTVCFLDDLGQAPAVVQAAAMQLILARRVNGHKVSDKVVFIAATNRKEDRAGVTGILEPVKSRFATIIELTPNLDDWTEWALGAGMPPELIAFNHFRPEHFNAPAKASADIVNGVSPRTIANLGRLFAAGFNDLETLTGAAGQGFAAEFLGFVERYQQLPSIEGILHHPETAPVPTEPSALYAVATALAVKTTVKNGPKVIQYMCRLPKEFEILGVVNAQRVCKGIANCAEYIQWAMRNQNVMV